MHLQVKIAVYHGGSQIYELISIQISSFELKPFFCRYTVSTLFQIGFKSINLKVSDYQAGDQDKKLNPGKVLDR
jgi:hypothetical protein